MRYNKYNERSDFMEKFIPKQRIYDGKNNDLAFSITYIDNSKSKKTMKIAKKIIINKKLLDENIDDWYKQKQDNYIQMLSDIIHDNRELEFKTKYHSPIIIEKNNHIIKCEVKEDKINQFTFITFNFLTLINDTCIHSYMGSTENFLKEQISKKNGYNIYSYGKKTKTYPSVKDCIDEFLKNKKMKNKYYIEDHTVIYNKNIRNIALKYINRNNLQQNLSTLSNLGNLDIIYGQYISKFGNILYILNYVGNFEEKYNELIPIITNSYDIIKQFILINIYLTKKYCNTNAELLKTRDLKSFENEILTYQKLRESLLKFSMGSVADYINEFEKISKNENSYCQKAEKQRKIIVQELKKRKTGIKSSVENIIAKTIAEITEKMKEQ